jgi:hypothetical protein
VVKELEFNFIYIMDIVVKTRSCNPDLYQKMRKFIPEHIECIRYDDYREWTDASRFLYDCIDNSDDIVVVVDDDCFITDWGVVEQIVKDVVDNEYAFAGMPDGGVIKHRTNSWVVANPFFLVLNCKLIKQGKNYIDRYSADRFGYNEIVHELKMPDFINVGYRNLDDEIFNGLFYYLASTMKPLYIKGRIIIDDIATTLTYNDKDFLIHTWYSREYSAYDSVRERIDNILKIAEQWKVNGAS